MVQAIIKEAGIQRDYLSGKPLETIYFGGGTPSLIGVSALEELLKTIFELFPISPEAEITLEANPDDLSIQKLRDLKVAGINRLSIGVQSFIDADLRWMNRVHDSGQALRSLELALECGFSNISADLIYGMPILTDISWQKNVRILTGLGISHLSCYALTVEPATALYHQIQTGQVLPVDPDQAARQFEQLQGWMETAGYEHYEISNFSRPGYRSRHNSNYWKGVHYLGLGPSAHSFNGSTRQWNVSNNSKYLTSVREGVVPFENEILTPDQQFNEYIMLSLRTMEGSDLELICRKWGESQLQSILEQSKKWQHRGLTALSDNHLTLTKRGKLMADGIAADLFR